MNYRILKILSLLVVCFLLFSLCGCDSSSVINSTNNKSTTDTSSNETTASDSTTDTVGGTTDATTTAPEDTKTDEPVTEQSVLKGRGKSDVGRSEPYYENITGYVASYKTEEYSIDPNWQVPIYQKDKQFYEEIGKIAHKTKVLVLEQELKHSGYGNYEGYLLVKNIDTEDTFYISVYNFINVAYWEYTDLYEATYFGNYIAEFNQKSNYYPVDKNGEKVELADGIKVLVTGKTGTMRDVDNDTHPIEATVYKEWKYGYGGVTVYFTVEDLSIVY